MPESHQLLNVRDRSAVALMVEKQYLSEIGW